MTDAHKEAALAETAHHLQEALEKIKTTLEVLTVAEMDVHSDTEDLFERVLAARAMSEAAYAEAQQLLLSRRAE